MQINTRKKVLRLATITLAIGLLNFGIGDENHGCQAFAKLAEYDQRSWLQTMGDPSPVAQSMANLHFSTNTTKLAAPRDNGSALDAMLRRMMTQVRVVNTAARGGQ